MDALVALARVNKISAPVIGKLNKFKQQASALAEKRNRLAHDPWYYEGKEHYRLQVTAKSTLDFAYKPTTEEDILHIEKEIVALADTFSTLSGEVLDAYYAR